MRKVGEEDVEGRESGTEDAWIGSTSGCEAAVENEEMRGDTRWLGMVWIRRIWLEGDRIGGECLINQSWKVAKRSGDGRRRERRKEAGEAEGMEECSNDGGNPLHPEEGERRVLERGGIDVT